MLGLHSNDTNTKRVKGIDMFGGLLNEECAADILFCKKHSTFRPMNKS